jgi:hypothetical protein
MKNAAIKPTKEQIEQAANRLAVVIKLALDSFESTTGKHVWCINKGDDEVNHVCIEYGDDNGENRSEAYDNDR